MNVGRERAVFAKYKNNLGSNSYRFVGVFKISGVSPDNDEFLRYDRISERVRIIKSTVSKQLES